MFTGKRHRRLYLNQCDWKEKRYSEYFSISGNCVWLQIEKPPLLLEFLKQWKLTDAGEVPIYTKSIKKKKQLSERLSFY